MIGRLRCLNGFINGGINAAFDGDVVIIGMRDPSRALMLTLEPNYITQDTLRRNLVESV
jgi:hypothetical protein